MIDFRITLAALLLAAPFSAQVLSGEFTPNPAPPGVPITFTVTDSTGAGLNLPSPCTWYTIHSGTPDGPVVPLGGGCGAVVVPVPGYGSHFFIWDQRDATGAFVPPGLYWVEAGAWDTNFLNQYTDFFCISIQGPNEPTLTYAPPAKVGTSSPFNLTSPNHPGQFYFVAASYTSNTPFQAFGQQFCLSPDALFNISIQNPSTFLTNSFGFLNAAGQAIGSLDTPNLNWLSYRGIHLQAVVATGGAPPFVATNDLSITILP